jgi:hypothetical protein
MRGKAQKKITPPPADTHNVTARCLEEFFWLGYRRGVNRLRSGKIFAGFEETRLFNPVTGTPDVDSPKEETAQVMGYRCGFAGLSVEDAAADLKEFLRQSMEP